MAKKNALSLSTAADLIAKAQAEQNASPAPAPAPEENAPAPQADASPDAPKAEGTASPASEETTTEPAINPLLRCVFPATAYFHYTPASGKSWIISHYKGEGNPAPANWVQLGKETQSYGVTADGLFFADIHRTSTKARAKGNWNRMEETEGGDAPASTFKGAAIPSTFKTGETLKKRAARLAKEEAEKNAADAAALAAQNAPQEGQPQA